MGTEDLAADELDPPGAGRRRGVLAMTLVVRDEEDILEANLRYHLAQGVDFVYAIDHNSTDGTPDILRSFEQMGVLRMSREDGDVHDQAPRVTRLARLAYEELGADWVINNDADEFWWPALGDLKDVLCAVPAPFGVVVARRHDFLPRPDAGEPFHQRMIWRHVASRTPTGGELGPKVAHRGLADVVVAPGNHEIYEPLLSAAPPLPLIEVLHFPARTYEQFARKTLNTGRGYELLPGRGSGTGIDQLELLKLLRAGELRAYYDNWVAPGEELERRVHAGTIVEDPRLRDFLAELEPRAAAHDPEQVRDVVRRALELGAALTEAQSAADELRRETARIATAREVDLGELADLRRGTTALEALVAAREVEIEALASALELVRNSRLMRSTRAIRRLYYRLR
ncbi:MAG TPA: glycosyltransferase family 2 protein [Solirubrobacteraceae bacterium]